MFSLAARIYARNRRLILVCLLLGLPTLAQAAAANRAVVVVPRLEVRRHPSDREDPVSHLVRGQIVEVMRQDGGWALIRDGDTRGYIVVSDASVVTYTAKKRRTVKLSPEISEKMSTRNLVTARKAVVDEETRLAVVRQEEIAVIRDVERYNHALAVARKRARGLGRELASLEKRVASALSAQATVESDIRAGRRRIMVRLAAYYKLHQIGEMNTFAASGSFQEMVVKKRALIRILGQDDRLLTQYTSLLAERQAMASRLAGERRALAAVVDAHEKERSDVAAMYRKRSVALKAVREKKALSLVALVEMKRSEKALNAKMAALMKARKALAAKKRFVHYKGLLKYPVAGKITKKFGPHKASGMNVTTFESGIDIRTQRGEPVHAVASGEVLFAGWLKGYGNLIIMNHGESWYSLYAHTDEVFKKKGARVMEGEVIATVGDSSLSGYPDLHFEIRHHGTPVSPDSWFKK